MKFILDNLLFIAIALVSGGLLLWPLIRKGGGAAALTPLEATQLINHRNAIVVDIRDEKDFQAGSLTGARNLPFARLAERAAELVRFKSRPVLIVCEAGQQSARAVASFTGQGFEEAHVLAGGVAAWKAAGLPLVQPGRDGARPVAKEAGRRNRNESRGGDRSKSGKSARPAVTSIPGVVAVAGRSASGVDTGADTGADDVARPVVPAAAQPVDAARSTVPGAAAAIVSPSGDIVPLPIAATVADPVAEPTRVKEPS